MPWNVAVGRGVPSEIESQKERSARNSSKVVNSTVRFFVVDPSSTLSKMVVELLRHGFLPAKCTVGRFLEAEQGFSRLCQVVLGRL